MTIKEIIDLYISFNIGLRTDDNISDSYKNINCEIKYDYTVNRDNSAGDSSAKLSVPLVPNSKESPAPLVKITHSGISGIISADKAFAFNIIVKNVGSTELVKSRKQGSNQDIGFRGHKNGVIHFPDTFWYRVLYFTNTLQCPKFG